MVNLDMKAELNVSVKGSNFDLNNKYLADMNVREAANIVFSMKQSDAISEDVIRNEIRQKIWEKYGTKFPLTIEKISYTEAVKGSVGALAGTNGQCAFRVVFYPAEAVKQMGLPLEVAVGCATINPARSLDTRIYAAYPHFFSKAQQKLARE